MAVNDPKVQVQLLVWIFVMRVGMVVTSAASYWLNGLWSKAKFGVSQKFDFETPLTTLVWLTSILSIVVTYVLSYLLIAHRAGKKSSRIAASQALIYKAARNAGSGFPSMTEAAQAKVFASETAIKVTNDALQIHGAMGYSRNLPLERMARDARMFTIGGGTAQMLRNQIASAVLDMKLPQTRDGYLANIVPEQAQARIRA